MQYIYICLATLLTSIIMKKGLLAQISTTYELHNLFRFMAGVECSNYMTFNPETAYGFPMGIKWLDLYNSEI